MGVSGAATASFIYDGDGQRVKGTVGSTTTVYLGAVFEWTGSTSTMKRYYYSGSIRIAITGGERLRYYGLLLAVWRPPGFHQPDGGHERGQDGRAQV